MNRSEELIIEFTNRLEQAEKEFKTRYSELAEDYKEVQELYSEQNVFSIAGEISTSVLDAAKQTFENTLNKGLSQEEFKEESRKKWVDEAQTASWNNVSARLEVIYRTNMQTAMAKGRIEKGKKMGVVGFRRMATHDPDVRDNHAAAHGLYYVIDSPDIGWFSLPWGYNCRCTETPITYMIAWKEGLLDENQEFRGLTKEQWERFGAYPDEGFERKYI